MVRSIERASLGVGVALRSLAGVPGGQGLVVTSVKDDAAGPLERGDVILAIGVRQVRSQNDLLRALRRDVANRRIDVLVLRDGIETSVECRPRSTRQV
jgi:S1-C subfamily serine protease